jgi:MraZ protein
MALTGTFERSLDEKKRIAVPKPLRDAFSIRDNKQEDGITHLFVAPGQDQSLAVFATADFEALAQRMSANTSNRTEVLNYQRLFFSRAEKVELDGQGRIRIPERLAALAGLNRDAVLLGVQDHAEIWDKVLWTEFEQRHTARFDEMAQAAFG